MTVTIIFGECYICSTDDIQLTTLKCGHELCRFCVLRWFKRCVETGIDPQCPYRCVEPIEWSDIFQIISYTNDPALFALVPQEQPDPQEEEPTIDWPVNFIIQVT